MICRVCGKEIPKDSEFCPFCGETIIAEHITNYCSACGKELPEDSAFCPFCGKDVSVAETPTKSKTKKKFTKAAIIITILAITTLGLAALNIVQYSNSSSASEKIKSLTLDCQNAERAQKKAEKEKSNLQADLSELRSNMSFYQRFVVFVDDDGSNRYHKDPDCFAFDSSYFWAYNIEAAEDHGYVACPYCN